MAQNTGADQAKHELDPRRKAALDTALAQVEKSFGKGSAMRLGDRPEQNVEVIPTGSLALDMALGIGGLPKGRIVEVYGEREQSPEQRLRDKDKRRAAYHRFYTNMKWGYAQNYHITLDSGELGIDKCADIIADLYKSKA